MLANEPWAADAKPQRGGTASSSGYSMLSGYWYGFQTFVREVFLPIILDS